VVCERNFLVCFRLYEDIVSHFENLQKMPVCSPTRRPTISLLRPFSLTHLIYTSVHESWCFIWFYLALSRLDTRLPSTDPTFSETALVQHVNFSLSLFNLRFRGRYYGLQHTFSKPSKEKEKRGRVWYIQPSVPSRHAFATRSTYRKRFSSSEIPNINHPSL